MLTPVSLFLLALAVRVLSWPDVFHEGRVHFYGTDAYYHMRRVLYSLANFPATLDFDFYINFPDGARPIWPSFFDSVIAWCLRPFYQAGYETGIERIAVWIPPLLGAATVLVLYFLAKRYFGFRTAWMAGLLLGILSGHFQFSRIGFIDHHAAVALVSTMLLASTMNLFQRFAEPALRPGRTLITALAVGFLLGGILLVWPGALLHAGIVELGLVVFLVSRPTSAGARRFALLFALIHGVAFLLVLPSGIAGPWPQWGRFSAVVLSGFQPWMFFLLAASGCACAALWRWVPAGRTVRGRMLQASGVGALLLAASLIVFPDLLRSAGDPWRWLLKQEAFQAMVSESLPLFHKHDASRTAYAELSLSYLLYPFPILLVLLSLKRRRDDLPSLWLLVAWTLGLGVVTLMQRRFINSFSIVFALVIAWSIDQACTALPRPIRRSPRRRVAAYGVLAVFLGFLLWPLAETYLPPLQSLYSKLGGRPLLSPLLLKKRAAYRTALWLRENTPPTSGFFDRSRRPEYGVLAFWGMGHLLEYVGRRPTVINNFGDDLSQENFELGRSFFDLDELEAIKILDRFNVAYVVAFFPKTKTAEPTMLHRLFRDDGCGLAHHRMVFEEGMALRPGIHVPKQPLFKVFEYVRGARVRGHAPPGVAVIARLDLHTNLRRRITFETSTKADSEGIYVLQLPYATDGDQPAVRTDAFYSLEAPGQSAQVAIDEEAVKEGRVVAGPDFQ